MPWGMASEAPSLAVIALPPLLPPPPVSTRHLETPRDGYLPVLTCVSSKIRAPSTCSQAEGRQFESGIPLDSYEALGPIPGLERGDREARAYVFLAERGQA